MLVALCLFAGALKVHVRTLQRTPCGAHEISVCHSWRGHDQVADLPGLNVLLRTWLASARPTGVLAKSTHSDDRTIVALLMQTASKLSMRMCRSAMFTSGEAQHECRALLRRLQKLR